MGILYEAMDVAKEEIRVNIGDESDFYWRTIDKIWDGYLHSHLHAAGQMLNPRIFYTAGFHLYTVIADQQRHRGLYNPTGQGSLQSQKSVCTIGSV